MDDLIRLVLSNFPVTCLVLGFAAAITVILTRRPPRSTAFVVDTLFAWYLLFSIGVAFLYNGVMHTVFGESTAKFIGWAPSPFQFEVGVASLGFSLVGCLAFRGNLGLRAGAVLGPAVFLLGAAGGHVWQMVRAGNFSPGNAGSVLWTDLLVPLIGLALLWRQVAGDRSAPMR